ncbi:ISAs1 family transposase [Nonomuraea sp. NPDC048892]|uniref:ISAs1 family transposase n=1 Tax=Nonomuraea sp. NPDC048892 TaxID=3154624 RepID=UPI0033D84718
MRDLLEAVDATAFAAACGSWLTDLTAEREQAGEQQDGPLHNPVSRSVGGRRHVAVDGKALRGTRHGNATGRAAHVLTAVTARTMGLLAQTEVDGKSNEITAFAPMLAPLDLAGVVVTVDALHTQREHATFLVENKRAHYILVVKKNQLNLYRQVKGLLWRQAPIMHSEDHHGHGRSERRQLKVLTVRSGIAFPYAAQAIAIIRKTRPRHGGRWKTVTVYAITSLATHQAGPAELAVWIRAHWQVEALHHVKDVTYREDSSRIRTGNGPAVMSALRTLAIGLLKAAGATNIAKATETTPAKRIAA